MIEETTQSLHLATRQGSRSLLLLKTLVCAWLLVVFPETEENAHLVGRFKQLG